ncbi:MAG: ferrochelatase [Terriglobales bacterium]
MTACPLGLASRCYCANQVSSFVGSPTKTAVLLLAHGSPENPDQVPEFLSYVTGGRPLPPAVVEEIRHRYALIGFSPLACWTLLQADQLARALQMPVFVGMRNWKPFIGEAVKAIAVGQYERVIAVCLAPQNSRTSVGLYRSAVVGAGNLPFNMEFVEEWHDQPLLAKAFAEKLRAGWQKACAESGAKLPVIFTAHSVPERTISEGDPYERQAKETAQLVAQEAGLEPADWTFAFQSQGMSGGAGSANPWIGPTVENTIRDLKAKGHRGVFLDPIGFLCDHVEVLYDIDIFFQQFAEKEGMHLWRAESLNGSRTLTAALAEVVRGRVKAPGI